MPSIADGERAASLHDALESLERASRTPAKQRAVKVSSVVDVVCNHAFEHGLDEEALRDVVQIAARKTDLDQTSVTTLLKNLYPAQRVSAEIVATVVAALGQGKGKPTPGTQNGLVKWLALVHEVLEEPDVLSRLYGVLFNMLDMISIRTPLCHLLSLITRRKHVKPFRIQHLLEFSRSLGNEPALQGLLRIYKDYYPDIILGSTSTTRNSFPPRPDPEWRSRLLAIQDQSAAAASAVEHNGFKVLRKGSKRIKASLIPDVHTFHANEASVTLEGIDNVGDFVEKLDRIEPPGQLISFLTDPLLQKFVDLKPSPIVERRIELWLSTCLEEQYNAVKEGTADHPYLSEVLDGLLKHAQYTKTLLPIVQAFLKEYLLLWDGIQDVDSILGLLSYISLQPFEEAYATFLQPAETALTTNNPNAYTHLLHFYTTLLRHWMNQTPTLPPKPTPALSHPHQNTLSNLTTHVSNLSTSLLLSHPAVGPDAPQTSPILSFYEHLSTTSTPHRHPILLPPVPLTSTLILSASPTTLSRTAAIIASYKSAFNSHPSPIRDYYAPDTIDSFNVTIRDVYHLLWISRALTTSYTSDTGALKSLGLYCAPELRDALHEYLGTIDRDYAIQTAFSISHNPALAAMAATVWRDVEEREIVANGYDREGITWHKGPVGMRSLDVLRRNGGVDVDWEGFRIEVLAWMEGRGLGGLKEFLWASSDTLRKKYGG
ncbi:Mis6-domain-containing protein [Massarina eburnea CBS 473.64]|uniref:Mis6-domain-containing protein n=1 Tax=Massarina eburnea CBS 473.64 TaxID=1395130 RepID=A0A6A6S0N9_9PLEO|nr:Mis6-domain-containing protein [Massarina eburnea CBS 473.64]